MSESSLFTSFPAISGGLPTGADLAPSIIFTVAFALLLPLAIWRSVQYRRPGRLLFLAVRLDLFIGIRLTTYIIRAIEAQHVRSNGGNPTPELGLFIAEQVLLGIGFIVLINNLVDYLKFQLTRTDCGAPIVDVNAPRQTQSRFSLGSIQRLMHIALIVSIILGIVAGTDYNSALTNPSGNGNMEVRTLRTASTAISLAVAALVALIALYIFFHPAHVHIPRRSSLYLAVVALVLLVIPAYRLSITLQTTHTLEQLLSAETKALFYVLQGLFEWVGTALLLAPDMRTFFGVPGTLVTPKQFEYDQSYNGQTSAGWGQAQQQGYASNGAAPESAYAMRSTEA